MADSLTFSELRRANLERLPHFKDANGNPAHTEPDGSDWSLADWGLAVAGEVGEAANILKKVRRGDLTLEQARPALAREFADIQSYLDHWSRLAGVDLGEATIAKWNEVSERIGYSERL